MSNQKPGEIVQVGWARRELNRTAALVKRPMVKFLGAPALQEPEVTKRLDRNSPAEPQEADIRLHEELVTVRSHIRSRPLRKDEPEVRVRTMTPEGREAWERAKRAED